MPFRRRAPAAAMIRLLCAVLTVHLAMASLDVLQMVENVGGLAWNGLDVMKADPVGAVHRFDNEHSYAVVKRKVDPFHGLRDESKQSRMESLSDDDGQAQDAESSAAMTDDGNVFLRIESAAQFEYECPDATMDCADCGGSQDSVRRCQGIEEEEFKWRDCPCYPECQDCRCEYGIPPMTEQQKQDCWIRMERDHLLSLDDGNMTIMEQKALWAEILRDYDEEEARCGRPYLTEEERNRIWNLELVWFE